MFAPPKPVFTRERPLTITEDKMSNKAQPDPAMDEFLKRLADLINAMTEVVKVTK